jgi:uncharacterized protein (DUF1800 family)
MSPSLVSAVWLLAGVSAFAQTNSPAGALMPQRPIELPRIPQSVTFPQVKIASTAPLSPRELAVQMLNRFTYGPRPGEVDQVLAQGPDAWLARQLNPGLIMDGALDSRLKLYPTLAMSPAEVLTVFPDRGAIQRVADGKQPYPADPLLACLYQVEVARLQKERQNKQENAAEPTDVEKATRKQANQAVAARVAGDLFALPKSQRISAFEHMPVDDRMIFVNDVAPEQRSTLYNDMSPREREVMTSMQGGVGSSGRAIDELTQAKLLRSVLSERQLQEVMTDFWFNHFNVFAPKDSDQWYTTAYERDAIRPHALGRFRDLLLATAQSPAMMVYLDNWLSVGPDSVANGVAPAHPNAKKGNKGLNENYGREVMELHTVGVNGGYTQADVTALSAILTGWGVDKPNLAGPFQFDPRKHEPGPKKWFGYTIDDEGRVTAGPQPAPALVRAVAAVLVPEGMKQGITALALLAASPRTAHFISFLLAQRFVADEPPPALVDHMTASYLASDGDIAAVLRTMAQSPEFRSHRYFRNKVKTPLEFLASAFRATATDPQNPGAMQNVLAGQFGEPLYRALPPTGYYITADHWMNTQSLMGRLNFADQLTHNRFANQKFDSSRVLALSLMTERTADLAIDIASSRAAASQAHAVDVARVTQEPTAGEDVSLHLLEGTLIGGEISPTTDRFIHAQMTQQPASNPAETLNLLTALLLGSPEFQAR